MAENAYLLLLYQQDSWSILYLAKKETQTNKQTKQKKKKMSFSLHCKIAQIPIKLEAGILSI